MKEYAHSEDLECSEVMVMNFYCSIVECDGNLSEAASHAFETYGLNWANSTQENDCWFDALKSVKTVFGREFVRV